MAVERDLIFLKCIPTQYNYADAITKVLGRTKHYQHFDYIMGRVRPTYADTPNIVLPELRYAWHMGGCQYNTILSW